MVRYYQQASFVRWEIFEGVPFDLRENLSDRLDPFSKRTRRKSEWYESEMSIYVNMNPWLTVLKTARIITFIYLKPFEIHFLD